MIAGLVALSTTACAYGVMLSNIDQPAGVHSYVTYFILEGASSGSPDLDQRITADIEEALADKGMIETSRDEGEAVVIANVATPAKQSRDAFYSGWGGWQWHQGGGGSTVVETYTVGTLVVDVFDARTKTLLWSASAPHAMPDKAHGEVHATEKAVAKMFTTFPWPSINPGTSSDQRATQSAIAADAAMHFVFSSAPALMIRIDGEPMYRAVEGAALQRVINTQSLIVRDESGVYYLRVGGHWLEAYELAGPWSTGVGPEGAATVLEQAVNEHGVDLLEDEDGSSAIVYVSTSPAALIVTRGEPQFAAVDGTSLLYVTNTTSCVLTEPTDSELYVFASDRWFRSWTTSGPWEYVPGDKLPADLANVGSIHEPLARRCRNN
jgi:hypothetical protein